jgi:hypothetical protein
MTQAVDMKKIKSFRIEEKLLAALEDLADLHGRTANSYLEELLFRHCQAQGFFPLSEAPPKSQRGGKRTGAGRRKAEPEEVEPEEVEPVKAKGGKLKAEPVKTKPETKGGKAEQVKANSGTSTEKAKSEPKAVKGTKTVRGKKS